MLEAVKELLLEVKKFVPTSATELEEFRLKYLGKKGEINALFSAFKEAPNESKKEFGQAINTLKQNTQAKIDQYKGSFEVEENNSEI
jgi:phenylalanyl-tRNA synthetase alpha chain